MRIDQLTKEVTLTEYEYKKLIMAQEELLAKIKAEIERRKGELKRYDNDDLIKYRAYDEMISIISSIDDVNETLKINEKMKQREQSFASRSAMSQEAVRNFRYLFTLESEKPEPFFYCKYGGIMPKCSDCKRNHSNSKYKTEDIENWFSPSERGTKQCSEYIPLQESEKPMNQEKFSKEFDDYFLPKNREQKGRWGFAKIYDLARHFAQWGAEHSVKNNTDTKVSTLKPSNKLSMEQQFGEEY